MFFMEFNMTVSMDGIPIRNENIISRKIEDEYILVPMLASSDEVEHIFNLNQVGADVWERIDGNKTVKDIVEALVMEYEGEPGEIEGDVIEFLNDILDAGIIELSDEGS